MPEDRLHILFSRYMDQTASSEEEAELFALLDRLPESTLENLVGQAWANWKAPYRLSDEHSQHLYTAIEEAAVKPRKSKTRVLSIHRRWIAVAATIVVALSAAMYWWTKTAGGTTRSKPESSQTIVEDISPGANRAILTRGDGSTVILDSQANRHLAGSPVQLSSEGDQLIYEKSTAASAELRQFNTLSTPRGGQFRLTLPDGSRVWLNAASSIKYPVAFAGTTRSVEITGEAYFEIAHNEQMPFVIRKGKTEVKVLGTEFNLNTYDDEENIAVTLVRGSVRIAQQGIATPHMLQPGQQLLIDRQEKARLIAQADIDKALAWKNGWFNFQGASLPEVMRQVSRWYDIDVEYEKGIPDIEFVGKMDRNVTISGLLNALKGFGVNCRLEAGRRLVVM